MSKFTPKLIEAISDQNLEQADDYLHLIVQESLARTLNEDHELYMTSSQMKSHLGKLYNLAKDQSSFLKTLANYSDKTECTEKDFEECAKNIVSKGKEHADKAIHKLEKLVGYEFDPKDLKEEFSPFIKRLMDAAINPKTIPNFIKNTKINKLKKSPTKLRKSVYGGGYYGNNGEASGGADGGGGGE